MTTNKLRFTIERATELKTSGTDCKHLQQKKYNAGAIIEGMLDAVLVLDLDGTIQQVNAEFERGTGWKREEIVGKTPLEIGIMSQEEGQKVISELLPILEKEGFVQNIERIVIRKDGTKFPVLTSWTLMKDAQGNPFGIISASKDITRLKQMEESLKESEQRFTVIFENAVDGILLADVENKKFYTSNKMICHMLGYDPEEIKNLGVMDIHPQDDLPYVLEQFEDQLKGKIKLAKDIPVKRKDGSVFYADINSSPIIMDGKRYLTGIFRDITERKQSEEKLQRAYAQLKEAQNQLIQAEKMSIMGELASGIAHEIKNPLAIIIQSVDYLKEILSPKQKEVYRILNMIRVNVVRADDIIHSLLDFSRLTELSLKPEDINSILEDSLFFAKQGIKCGQNIEIVKKTKQDIPKALVDKDRMNQIFINIFLNAFQAMPKGGEIIISTDEIQLNEIKNGVGRRSRDYFRLGEKAVLVEIEDTGIGISEENLKRIFDPFFTTKGPGEGTGLGLSVSRNLIDLHKGLIEINSGLNEGTKITIILKIAEER
ncbi:MAG: PAS domain S-box protein [bacterium]